MTEEHSIQNGIRLALADTCVIFRGNVGRVKTPDGRYFDTGLPKGFSDLFGFRKSDSKAVFIEVKTPKGTVSKEQKKFIKTMKSYGAIAGVCRNPQEAKILTERGY